MLTLLSSRRFLAVYSGFLMLVFVVTVLCGATALRNVSFGTIARIQFLDADGHVTRQFPAVSR